MNSNLKDNLGKFKKKIIISISDVFEDNFTLKEFEELENSYQDLLNEFLKPENVEDYLKFYEEVIELDKTLKELRKTF